MWTKTSCYIHEVLHNPVEFLGVIPLCNKADNTPVYCHDYSQVSAYAADSAKALIAPMATPATTPTARPALPI